MISYAPLARTLASRNLSIKDLGKMLNNRSLRAMINSGDRLSIATLDKICTLLCCNVEDVIVYKPGPQTRNSWVKSYEMNWDEIKRRADEKGWTYYFISKEMGKYPGYLSGLKNSRTTSKLTAKTLASWLGCDVLDIAKEVIIEPKDKEQ